MRVERLQYDGFDYDLGNVRKIQSHGLSLGEIEDFFAQDLLILEDTRHSNQKERRLIAVGRSRKRRPMFVAFTLRTKGGETYIRPISARYCHKKEAELYENLKKNISKDE